MARSGRINQVGYMARYSDITERAKELVQGRDLGMGVGRFMARMPSSHSWWGKAAISAGQIVEQSTHIFDWLRYFLGEIESVQAFGHDGPDDTIADFDDSTTVNLRFVNGAVGSIVSTCSARVHDTFVTELLGREFYLRLKMTPNSPATSIRTKSTIAARNAATSAKSNVLWPQSKRRTKAWCAPPTPMR